MGDDSALLDEYSSDPRGGRGKRVEVAAAAARCVRIGGALTGHARGALAALAADPHGIPEAVPNLLDVASAAGASTNDLAAFAASSLAWKAIVAALMQGDLDETYSVEVRKRTLFESAIAATLVLEEVASTLSSTAGDPSTPQLVARYLKIVRFHTVNLARCAKRFLDGGLKLLPADACVSAVLRNLEIVMRLALLEQRGFNASSCADQLQKSMLVPASAAVRAVLLMCARSDHVGEAVKTAFAVSKTTPAADTALAGRVLVVTYLIRLAESGDADEHGPRDVEVQDDEEGASSNGPARQCSTTEDLCTFLRAGLVSDLVPLLLLLLRSMNGRAFNFRTRLGHYHLASLSASVLGDVMCTFWSERAREKILMLLMTSITDSSAVVAFVCGHVVKHIAMQRPSAALYIFPFVLSALRLAMSANVSSADTRLLGPVSTICLHLCDAKVMTPELLFRDPRLSESGLLDVQTLDDAVGLRVVGESCFLARKKCDDTSYLHVFEALALSKEKLASFCKSSLMSSSCSGRMAESCVVLLRHVCDPRAASGAALACMKRTTSRLSVVISAVLSLDPVSMPEASLRAVAAELPRTVERHGLEVCPATLGFVRGVLGLLEFSTFDPTTLAPIVEASLRCTTSTRATIASSATIYHGVELKKMNDTNGLPSFCFDRSCDRIVQFKEYAETKLEGDEYLAILLRERNALEQERNPGSQPAYEKTADAVCVDTMSQSVTSVTRALLGVLAHAEEGGKQRLSVGLATEVDSLLVVVPALAKLSSEGRQASR